MKKVISYFLSILTVFSIISVGFAVPASAVDSSWSEAYNCFITAKNYNQYLMDTSENYNDSICLSLYDIDGNSIPELIVDQHYGGGYFYNIFSIDNGKVVHKGEFDHRRGKLFQLKSKEYPGIVELRYFHTSGNSLIYTTECYYYSMPSNIKCEFVLTQNIENDSIYTSEKHTTDSALFDLCNIDSAHKSEISKNSNLKEIQFYSENEIKEIGWTSFCKKYGYSVNEEKTTTPQKSGNTQLTDTQKKELEKFLNTFLSIYSSNFSEKTNIPILPNLYNKEEFDCKNCSDSTLLASLLCYGAYQFFDIEGNREEIWNNENANNPDPKNRFNNSYTKTKASYVDWIAENLFNCSENDIIQMRKNGEKSFSKYKSDTRCFEFYSFYYNNGYYYCKTTSGIGCTCSPDISIENITKDGDSHIVKYSIYIVGEGERDFVKTSYVKVKYKTIEGKNYWSMYQNSQNEIKPSSIKANTVYTKNVKDDSDNNPTTKTFKHSLEYYIQQKKSTEYNPELAELLMWFAHSSYIHSDTFEEKPEKLHIRRTYESFGFDVDDKKCYRNYNYFDKNDKPISGYEEKYCAWSVGVKDIDNGKKLVMITVRGTSGTLGLNTLNMNNEWWGDFCVADAATFTGTRWHRNFNDCADKIYASLKDFDIDVKSDKYIFCLTGHSKGAGVANLTAMLLDQNGVENSRVYDYNFACPDVAVDYHTSWSTGGNHDNIFNICNACDLVTYVPALLCDGLISTGALNPLTHWGKYGITKWFSFDWNEIGYTNLMAFFANLVYGDNGGMPGTYISKAVASNKKRYNPHDPLVYLAYLSQKVNIDKMKDREIASIKAGEAQAKIALEELNMAFFAVAPTGALAINGLTNILVLYIQCPVDFTVTDLSGNVLAKCVNNKPEYFDIKDNYILIGVEGDRKSVLIANPSAVKINIVATDSGTMEFSAEHLGNAITGKEDENGVSYTNIALEKGKKMLFKFDDAEKLSNNIMFVVDDNENPIAVIDFNGKENNDTKAIAKAEKQAEDAGESTKISKKTIIIISVISALVLIAAAIILIKKFKTDKTKAVPEEEVYTEPQEEYSRVTPVEAVETPEAKEEAAPPVRQAESEIKLSCVKCEAGGICSMCKAETEQLYSITASKNGKSQTVTVCRTCGEKIIRKYKK